MSNKDPIDFTDINKSSAQGNDSKEQKKVSRRATFVYEDSSGGVSRGICHVLMMIGSVITFIRNTVFNIIFIFLILAIFIAWNLMDTVSKKASDVITDIAGEEEVVKSVKPVLYFNLSGPIVEYPLPDDDYSVIARSLDEKLNHHVTNDILTIEKALELSQNSKDVKEIYFNLSGLSASLSTARRIAKSIQDFKKKDKDTRILAYADSYSASAYQIARNCDEIVLNPMGDFSFKGFAAASLYYKELFEKFSVEPLVFKAGEFKSAVEPFTQNQMSQSVKDEYTEIFESLWSLYKKASGDKASAFFTGFYDRPENFLSALDAKRGNEARLLLDAGLVTRLADELEINSAYADKYGFKKNLLHPNLTDYRDFVELKDGFKRVQKKPSGNPKIAVMYGIGEIRDYAEDQVAFTPENIRAQINKILNDKNVKAVVFYINSPGGSVTASEKIRLLVKKLKETKKVPVYVSMNSLCASGGYWVSTAADRLFATPETITGSIGVFSLGFSVSELLNEYGVYQDGVETSELAKPAIALNMPQSQKQMIELNVKGIYADFISLVKDSRKELKNVNYKDFAEGKIFMAQKAQSMHLIDDIKTFRQVLEMTRQSLDETDRKNAEVMHVTAGSSGRKDMLKALFFSTASEMIPEEYLKLLLKLNSTVKNKEHTMMAISPLGDIQI